jgi:glycosyltransferase involved in cell wall biosynthesis
MDRIVFVSENTQIQFNRLFPGMEVNKQLIIPNLIDKKEIREKAGEWVPDKQKMTFALIGRLNPIKGVERFLEVVYRLKNDGFDFQIWIIGDGELKNTLTELVISKGLKEVVFFKGFQKNVYPFMKSADLFLNVSFAEGSPLSIAEALCLDVPVLATETIGAKELLNDGDFGLLVENSEEGVYQGLKRFLQDETMWKKYRERAKKGASRFEVKKTITLVSQLFEISKMLI